MEDFANWLQIWRVYCSLVLRGVPQFGGGEEVSDPTATFGKKKYPFLLLVSKIGCQADFVYKHIILAGLMEKYYGTDPSHFNIS